MAGTRSSARLNSSPQSENSTGGTKRKADDTSPTSKSKRGRPSKEQKTLEETINPAENQVEADGDEIGDEGVDVNGQNGEAEADAKEGAANGNTTTQGPTTQDTKKDESKDGGENAFDRVKADEGEEGKTSIKNTGDENETAPTNDGKESAPTGEPDVKAKAVEEDKKREDEMPSNILEKGLIYFFTRGRVGVDDPQKVQDLQRSYFVLRPLPDGAKLTDGAIQDVGNNRLIALPKKVWPKSGKDRFMVFVEKAKASMDTLKEEFFQGSDYSTQTMGIRHTPEVTPIGEGVYAFTSTGGSGRGTTHLAYMLTIPSELGEVQKDVGLANKGSFILSVKNPEAPAGPGAVQLPPTAEYPKEFIEEFGGRAWAPAEPKHIDYAGASVLLIGEDFDSSSNLEPTEEDKKVDTTITPQEELEKLEKEDELRVQNLRGDDTIFADLHISSKEYPKVMTTW